MAKSELKLLGGWFSPFSLRVQIALNIKGLDYEFVEEDITSKSDLLLKSNPVHGKIPVLLHGDKPICESIIIIEYIDDVWSTNGPSILPQHAYDRANARFWSSYIDAEWLESMRSILMAGNDKEAKKPHFEQMVQVVLRMEEVLNKCSEGNKPFFGGDNIGLIDIAFGSFLSWMRVIEEMIGRKVLVEVKAPSLVKWAENFCDDPAVKGILPETDKLTLFGKALQQKWGVAY